MRLWSGTTLGLWLIMLLLPGCTATRFLKEGETFYEGAVLDFEMPQGRVRRRAALERNLQELIQPKPNKKFLGMRPGAWFYYVAGTPKKKKGGLRNFIRNKLGQPPVLLKDATPERTAALLQGEIRNEGYFRSTVAQKVETKGKASTVRYAIVLYRPYRLRNIAYPKGRDSTYARILHKLHEESLLDSNQRYDLARMKAEQERIEREVENVGFYYFDDRYLLFEADSTVGKRKVDLQLRLEPDIPARARRIYRLNEVNIYPDYVLSTDTVPATNEGELILVDGFRYFDRRHNFRPQVITRVINLQRGDVYSREAQDLTLSHLMGLGAFKFVNVKFEEAQRQDSSMLNANIYLTPLRKKSLRAEVQAVSKSNNFVGPGASLSFTNRNFLRGAELFQIKLHSAYEYQISRQSAGSLNSFEAGFEASLTVPRFITPIRIDYSSRRYLPKTQFKTAFNLQNRVSYFRLNSFNVGYGYNWQESVSKSHELFPADITFVRTDKTSPRFDSLLQSNPVLANSFENQFIVGTRYTFTLNTQIKDNTVKKFEAERVRPHNFYLSLNADVAGNLLHAVQSQVDRDKEGPYMLFNSPYSQFVRGAVDFRHYWDFDEHNKLVTRLATGIGYAFGNSVTMPYIKQFSVGGSNSIRAFPARSVGPGTYDVRTAVDSSQNNTRLFIDQRGDIKLEGNVEYRFDIIRALKGAVFVDAGNIWLIRSDSTRAGGEFKRGEFLKQLAVGTGLGLRVDFSFFVLRLDVAFPLRKPYLPENERWVIRDIDFGSSRWRGDNLIFNIAIGYPF